MYTQRGRTLNFCNGPPPQLYTPALALWDCVIYTQFLLNSVYECVSVPYPPHPTVCRLYGRSMLHVRKCQVPLSPPFQHSLYHKVPSFLLSSNSYLPMLMPLLVLYTPISHILPLIVLHTPISHILMPFLDIWVSSYIAYVFFSFFLKGGRGRSSPTHSKIFFASKNWDLEA